MFNKDEKTIFNSLNERLETYDQSLEIICAGGYVLDRYDIRSTMDIDAFFQTNHYIENAIKEVGDIFEINPTDELWLNNSIQSMNKKPPLEICDILYEFSNLKVYSVPLDYAMCMKLSSARERDIDDVSKIIKKLEIPSPKEMNIILEKYDFNNIDESIILEVFGEAYGMEWLEKYYVDNIEPNLNNSYDDINVEYDDWDDYSSDWND